MVEVGVEGLPDKWIVQVYDTGECDPSYTFYSPVKATESDIGLEDMPEAIAQLLATERSNNYNNPISVVRIINFTLTLNPSPQGEGL